MAREAKESSATSESASAPNPRLTVQLDDKGGIAWDRMRATTRDQLKAALGVAEPGAPAPEIVAADALAEAGGLAEILYVSSSSLLVALARRQGYTSDQAQVLAFTADEREALKTPTAKVIAKWLPTGKYQDELLLGFMLVTIISGKLTLLRRSAAVISVVPQRAETPSADTAS